MAQSLWGLVPELWRPLIVGQKDQLGRIEEFLVSEIKSGKNVNPKFENILRTLDLPPAEVKVVILGQDPYPDARFAIGRAFAVPSDSEQIPPSLRNIFTELQNDLGRTSSAKFDLDHWSSQGVLLLNQVLTVPQSVSNGHNQIGWQLITSELISKLSASNPNLIAILWGAQAQKAKLYFRPDLVIASAHPSPLSAHRGFFGSQPFSRANDMLRELGESEIDW